MKIFSNIFKQGLLLLIFACLFLPLIQNKINFILIEPLKGDVSIPADAHFNCGDWFSGSYQEKQEEFINSGFGFRNFCVRLNNQITFSFFNKATANGVVIGKDNYLYEENYLKAYTGKDFLGEDSVSKIINRIKYISDTLAKLDKQLIIVFAAGKASFYPEFIPEYYLPVKGNSNYKAFSAKIKNAGIEYIDFNKWFMEQKMGSKFPLYPQYGIHWSIFGTVLAADSIIKKIEDVRKIDMPNILYSDVEIRNVEGSDYDIADGMNLLFKLKSFEMAYPIIKTEKNNNKIRPKVLVISDSFYWQMYGFGIANSFQNDHFWYYNKQVYPETFNEETVVENLDLKMEIDNHEVFIVMATEATLNKIGWGFFENIESYFKGRKQDLNKSKFQKQMSELKKTISKDVKWMEDIKRKAEVRKISVDSMVTLDAIWTLKHPN